MPPAAESPLASPMGQDRAQAVPAVGGITRAESGGQGRKAAQLAAMNVVDRVRFKMVDAVEHGTAKTKTQKQLERSIVVGKKAHDDELLLESYFALAQYWEDHESAEEVQLNLQCAMDVIVRLRGGKSRLVPDDPVPLTRIMEQRGRLHEVQALYKGIVEAIQTEFGQKEKRALPFVERLLDVSLRMRSMDTANIQQQTVQRLRENNTPRTMQWYHPPQGEMRVVPHIEHMNTHIELGLYSLAKRDVQRALKEFTEVTDWRNTIRQYRKDWRRKDASLEEQVRSLEIIAEAVFRVGEVYSLMNRTTTAERRMLEGIEHWEELIALEDAHHLNSTVAHLQGTALHARQLATAYQIYAQYLMGKSRYVEALTYLSKILDILGRAPLRAFSPTYIRTLQQRAQMQLDCHQIPQALEDYMLCTDFNQKLYGNKSVQVALSLSDQARFIMYLTEPREEEWQAALNRSMQGLKLCEMQVAADDPRLMPVLRIRGCLLLRRSTKEGMGAILEGLQLLERWHALLSQYPNHERRVQDKMFALESLAEGYSHLQPPKTEKALEALRECIRLLLAEEMAGRRDEDKMTHIKDRLDKVHLKQMLPREERYRHSWLRSCGAHSCRKPETRPDQFHRWKAGGVLRFCSDTCMVEFENYAANNNWFGLDSACPAGPLPDILLLRVMTFVPECPHWSLLAMASTRLWSMVSKHRTSIRFAGDTVKNVEPAHKLRFTGIDPVTVGNLLARSPRLQHIDLSDSSVVDDKVCFHIGTNCPRLRTLSLRGSPQITDIGMEDIAMCRVLQRLDLSFCHLITDEGIVSIARNMPELQLLAIAHCTDVTEEGVQAIAKGCRNLVYLDMAYCKRVKDRGLRSILRHCPQLGYLDVRGVNNLTTAELRRAERQVDEVQGLPWKDVIAADLVSTVDTPRFRIRDQFD